MRTMTRLVVCAFVLATAADAAAQTKFAGKCSQPKPDPSYTIPVGDREGHAMSLMKAKCTWSGAELAGVALKDEEDTVVSDLEGSTSRDNGYGVGMLTNGDKYFVQFEGTTTFKNGAPATASCTWRFTGGTGKVMGLTGKGTCSGTFDSSGGAVFDIQGDYQVGAAKAK